MTSIEYKYDFKAGIHLSGQLWFNHFVLELELFPSTDNEMDQNTAFDRMHFVINDIISRSVFVNENDTDSILKIAHADIPVLTVPDPGPIDQVLQFVITSKLSAVIEGTFYIGKTKISSEIGNGVTYVYNYDEEDEDEETRTSIVNESPLSWWNDSEPRFVTLSEQSELDEFVAAQTWEMMGLLWEEDSGEIEVLLDDPAATTIQAPENNIIQMPVKDDS